MNQNIKVIAVGNLYVETNYIGINNEGKDVLDIGKEYSAPSYEIRLGGSAVNFATQIKKFGINVGIIGKTGRDDISETLFELLHKEGVGTDLIKSSGDLMTNVDTGVIFARSGQNIQLVAGNANQSLSYTDIDLDNKLLKNSDALYFGGSFKQKLLWPKYPEIFSILKKRQIKLFIDPGRIPIDTGRNWINVLKSILPITDGYFPNDKEILSVTGKSDIRDAINEAFRWGPKMVVVKLGPEGCLIRSEEGILKINGFKVRAISTVGAGDVFNAAFIYKYLLGDSLKDCGIFANSAAALRVSMNRQHTLTEIAEFIDKNIHSTNQ